jgi:alkaline phosphatase
MKNAPKILFCGVAALLAYAGVSEAASITRLTPPSIKFLDPTDDEGPYISRFLPGQRFDLQATIQPESGRTVASAVFKVDGATVSGTVGLVKSLTLSVTNVTGKQLTVSSTASLSIGMAVTGTGLAGSSVIDSIDSATQVTLNNTPTGAVTTATFDPISATSLDPFNPNLAATPILANTAVATLRAYSNTAPGVHSFTCTATLDNGNTVTATGNFEVLRMPALGSLKNVIFLIGDGMGAAHRTAARIMSKGISLGKANGRLNMDTFPVTGMVETASLNSIITDSSPGAACYSTGNKSNNNQQGVFPDDTRDFFDNPRVELIGEFLARKRGKSLGIVATSDLFDATPGAFGSHTSNRGAGTGICDGYLDEMASKSNLSVLLGGGRKWFLPAGTTGSARSARLDASLPADVVDGWGLNPLLKGGKRFSDASRDLLADFQTAGFQYAPDKTTLSSKAASGDTSKLLGLFSFSNMNVALDKINGRRGTSTVVNDFGFPDQPMLDEMTDAALKVLNRNPKGFVLMVEAASIDKQAHSMDAERWILDTIEFDRAVGVAQAFAAADKNTLVIITADHECAGASLIGASVVPHSSLVTKAAGPNATDAAARTALRDTVVGVYESAGFPNYTIAADGYPVTTDVDYRMLIGYGGSADRYENWITNPFPVKDSQQPLGSSAPLSGYPTIGAGSNQRDVTGNLFLAGQVSQTNSGGSAVHTASDIPLSAFGRGATGFSGYMDNTEVFFRVMRLMGVR